MRKLVAVLVMAIFLLSLPTYSQVRKGPQKASLESVLACTNDLYIETAFKTNLATMRKLKMSAMIAMKKTDPDFARLQALGFQTLFPEGSLDLNVFPNPIVPPTSFCSGFLAEYLRDDDQSLPYRVEIPTGPEFWTFNPNEVFEHADQVTFKSGIFEDSPKVFFSAVKARTTLQFLATPDGLVLFRVFIKADSL